MTQMQHKENHRFQAQFLRLKAAVRAQRAAIAVAASILTTALPHARRRHLLPGSRCRSGQRMRQSRSGRFLDRWLWSDDMALRMHAHD